jgi:hypothetical protein
MEHRIQSEMYWHTMGDGNGIAAAVPNALRRIESRQNGDWEVSLISVTPLVLHLANGSDSFLLARSKTSEIGITAKACFGKFISSFDFDLPNLCNGPPEIFCEHNPAVHLSLLGNTTA